ncbi:hypothetical protein NFI96_023714 [Prochilodus magdalenae]|nr:hypothetical protein NFI96_023714 [Prochilodus magdalenae]
MKTGSAGCSRRR